MGIKKRESFTLIEMIIVVGVLGFALPVLFAIMFIVIQQQTRIYALQEVKRQGDIAIFSIKSSIRQYGKLVANLSPYPNVTEICPPYPTPTLTPAPYIMVYDSSMADFSYKLINNKIASESSRNAISNNFLTDESVVVSNLQFSCYRTNQFSPPIVWTSFTVTKSGTDPNLPSMQYNSRFKLRSY
jgi:type II secretory pathway pseudopilin PulG